MFKWCSYCQEFIGEKEPLNDYRISHGICPKCVANAEAFSEDNIEGREQLARFYNRITELGREGDPEAAAEIIEEALQRGLNFSDLCIGFLQPALYQIGKLWETGQVTVADEHRFTAWCEGILASAPSAQVKKKELDVLLVPVEGNYHSLGARFLSHWLTDRGYSAKTIYPGVPTAEILDLVDRYNPKVLGISIGCLPENLSEAQKCWAKLKPLAASGQLKVAFGGLACRLYDDLDTLDIPLLKTNEELLSLLRQSKSEKVENNI